MVGLGVTHDEHVRFGQVEQPLQAGVGAVFVEVFVDAARAAVGQYDPQIAQPERDLGQ